MNAETKVSVYAAAHSVTAVICLALMYVAYRTIHNEHLFAVSIGILGAAAGFFLAKGSSVRSEAQIRQILGAALIREKELEAKSLDELRDTYRKELQGIKEIIEREGNLLLLQRLRELNLKDLREKLREVESIDDELQKLQSLPRSDEVMEIRRRMGGVLDGVRNPEQDDRLVRQFLYSIPILGNVFYLAYIFWKTFDPTLEDKVHRRLHEFTRLGRDSLHRYRTIVVITAIIFLIGIIAIVTWIYRFASSHAS
jgi:hypothetical protein